jgi:hypothetical protein
VSVLTQLNGMDVGGSGDSRWNEQVVE